MKRLPRVFAVAGAVVFWLGSLETGWAQVRVAVKAKPVERIATAWARPEVETVASKLSPDLSTAVLSDAIYVGQTRQGEAVLQFAEGIDAWGARTALARVPGVELVAEAVREFDVIDKVIVNYKGDGPKVGQELAGLRVLSKHGKGRFVVVESKDGFSPGELRGLAESEQVEFAEPDYKYYLEQQTPATDDPYLRQLWGMFDVRAPAAWQNVSDAEDVVVAVIDTGIDLEHEDLETNVWINSIEKSGKSNVDDDNNGYVDDVHGFDFFNYDGGPVDGHGHGTHCAGTIGAVGNNATGVVGVAWRVELMAVQIFSAEGESAGAARIAEAIDYAVDNGAHILSNSWSGPRSQNIQNAISRAESVGVLAVAAAGNDGINTDVRPRYPASYPNENIISVGWVNQDHSLDIHSNYGRLSVDLGAPGGRILSTVPGSYGVMSGTSMATPHVSGAAALIWRATPAPAERKAATVRQLILDNVRPLASLAGKCVTEGTLDVSFLGRETEALASAEGISSAPTAAAPDRSRVVVAVRGRPREPCSDEPVPAEAGEAPTDERVYRVVVKDGGLHFVERASTALLSEVQKPVPVAARESHVVEIACECTTKGTDRSGARNSCTSNWSTVTLPAGFVYNEHSLDKRCRSCNGSSNHIDHQWEEYVELIAGTGLKAPRTLRVRVHARSPKCRGCRGWTKATVTAQYVKYQ